MTKYSLSWWVNTVCFYEDNEKKAEMYNMGPFAKKKKRPIKIKITVAQ